MGVNGIYGLSGSGLDIESMVKVGMMSRQSEYDKMYKKETKMEWQKEAYAGVYTDLMNFGMNKMTDYKLQSNMNAMSATSSDTSAVSVTANGSAVAMNHTVKVNSVTTNAYFMSTEAITRANTDSTAAESVNLKDVVFQDMQKGYQVDGIDGTFVSMEESDDGTLFTLKKADGTAGAYVKKGTDSEGNATYQISTDNLNWTAYTETDESGKVKDPLKEGYTVTSGDSTKFLEGTEKAISFKLGNGKESAEISFTYEELAGGKTLNDLASEIKKSGLNITASYDTVNDSFSLYNTTGGEDHTISIEVGDSASARLFNNLHLGQSSGGSLSAPLSFGNAALTGTVSNANTGSADSTELKDVMFPGFVKNTDNTYGIKDAEGHVTSTVNGTDTAFSFEISNGDNTKTVSFTYDELADASLDDLAEKINNSGADVTASYAGGKFSITNNTAEAAFSVKAKDDGAAALFQHLGLGTNVENGDEISANAKMEIAGTDGSITVDGRTYDGVTTGKVTVGGVTYSLLNQSEPVTVTVTQDTDAIVDRVKQFVEDYNTMLDSLQEKYNETVYRDYGVLTRSQEDAMTKEQIEKWNEKAKSGLLNHDKYIGDIISQMREALATPVEGVSGKYNSAFSLGITTTNDRGHIKLDDEKLKKVLAQEPNSVYEIFGKLDAKDDASGNGVAQRLGDVMNKGMSKLKDYAGTSTSAADGSTLGDKILQWQNKMSDFKTKMSAFENLLYKKYDAMEVALQRLSMTLNYVSFNNG